MALMRATICATVVDPALVPLSCSRTRSMAARIFACWREVISVAPDGAVPAEPPPDISPITKSKSRMQMTPPDATATHFNAAELLDVAARAEMSGGSVAGDRGGGTAQLGMVISAWQVGQEASCPAHWSSASIRWLHWWHCIFMRGGSLSGLTTQAQRTGPRDATIATVTRWLG